MSQQRESKTPPPLWHGLLECVVDIWGSESLYPEWDSGQQLNGESRIHEPLGQVAQELNVALADV